MSGGIAWGTALSTLSGKADRAEVDALKRDASSTHDLLLRIDTRVAEMYCATLPVDNRAGCR